MKYLRSDFFGGEIWKRSLVFRLVTAPIRGAVTFARHFGERISSFKDRSMICSFLNNLADIPIREFGILIFATSLGAVPSALFFGKSYFWLPPAVALLMCLIPASARSLSASSLIGKLVLASFFDDERGASAHEPYHIKKPIVSSAICFIAGLLLGTVSPLLAIIVPIGMMAVGAVMARYELGVFVTATLIPVLPTMALIGLASLTLASFALRVFTDKSFKYRATPLGMPIFFFLTVLFISVVFGVSKLSSLKVALLYTVFTLFLIPFVNAVRTERQWKNTVFAMLITSALVSFYGILQNFALASTTSSWVDSNSFGGIRTRVYSTLSNPNVLGQYLLLMIPIALALLWTKEKEWRKFVNIGINALMFLCLIFTWSRGAWLGVLIAVAFFIIRHDKFWLAMCVLAVLVVPSVLPASIIERFMSIGDTSDSSTAYRVAIWVAAFRLLSDNLAHGIGVGVDAFTAAYPPYALSGAEYALHSHNFFFQQVVDMGIPGLLAFIMIISCAYKQIISAGRRSAVIRTVLLAMGCGILGWLLQGISENLWYNNRMILLFWTYMALIQSGSIISREEDFPALVDDLKELCNK